jgi:hypothetical protein
MQADTRYVMLLNRLRAGATIPELTPRQTMVLILALCERAGVAIPFHERSTMGEDGRDNMEEAEVLLSVLADTI